MATIHTDSAYTGISAEPKIEVLYVLEDNEADQIMFESETQQNKIYDQDKNVNF
ncbi:putative GPI-anchor transamidase [Cocos nucifera]|uniref:Putative GPI-anchor transamidase n=1 Tax=Cocos nucifera TaxID=13894 RepID=A0A8K0MYZ4_COCNU|nr:putative GPI-anchor transamidase [Cocos nucifera]